jgi:hypothetical protein
VSLDNKIKFALAQVPTKIEGLSDLEVSSQKLCAPVILISNLIPKQTSNARRAWFGVYITIVETYNDLQKEGKTLSRYKTDVFDSDTYESGVLSYSIL